VLTMY